MRDTIPLICEFCGELFDATRYDAKYCSPAHRTAAHRAKKKHRPRPDDWLLDVDQKTIDTFYYVRTISDKAARMIEMVAKTYGSNAAKLATWASWYAEQQEQSPQLEQWEIEINNRS